VFLERDLNAGMKAVLPKRMKTAVSLPDPLFEAADQLARQLGKSRSQLYAEALREYLERHRDEDITRRLNEIFDAEA
jgi:metal-responsive CopG/Arc/MetJ family transcriptional regulator